PPLVLVHGTPFSSQVWRRIAPWLARRHRVFFYDLLGYGQSDMPDADVSLGRQNVLFGALLDVSRLDAGVVDVHRRPVHVDAVLEHACTDHLLDAAAKNLTLTRVPCRAIVDTDPVLLERIVRNLVSNAVRYTDAGRIVVG
ncbi:alpha/beta fold hydrolase, partial [Paraburkholderia sp. SIMBA_050]